MKKSSVIKWMSLAILTTLAEVISQTWPVDIPWFDFLWERSEVFDIVLSIKTVLLVFAFIGVAALHREDYRDFKPILLAEFVPVVIFFIFIPLLFTLTSYALALGSALIIWTDRSHIGEDVEGSTRPYPSEAGVFMWAFTITSAIAMGLIAVVKTVLTLLGVSVVTIVSLISVVSIWFICFVVCGLFCEDTVLAPEDKSDYPHTSDIEYIEDKDRQKKEESETIHKDVNPAKDFFESSD